MAAPPVNGNTDGVIRLPNNVANEVLDADISCKQLFVGASGMRGLCAWFGKPKSLPGATNAEKTAMLTSLGYEISEVSSDKKTGCISLTVSPISDGVESSAPFTTNQVCFPLIRGSARGDDGYTVDYANGLASTRETPPVYLVLNNDYLDSSLELWHEEDTASPWATIQLKLENGGDITWGRLKAEIASNFSGEITCYTYLMGAVDTSYTCYNFGVTTVTIRSVSV